MKDTITKIVFTLISFGAIALACVPMFLPAKETLLAMGGAVFGAVWINTPPNAATLAALVTAIVAKPTPDPLPPKADQ